VAKYDKVCKQCGKEFEAENYRLAYCSEGCRAIGTYNSKRNGYMKREQKKIAEGKSLKNIKVCLVCGSEVITKQQNRKYCSKSCLYKANPVHSKSQSKGKNKSSLSANGTLCWHCEWATGKDGQMHVGEPFDTC